MIHWLWVVVLIVPFCIAIGSVFGWYVRNRDLEDLIDRQRISDEDLFVD